MTYEKTVLLIVTATSFVTPFMGSSLNIAIPSIGHEFSVSATVLSWVATAYILANNPNYGPFGVWIGLLASVLAAGVLFTWRTWYIQRQ